MLCANCQQPAVATLTPSNASERHGACAPCCSELRAKLHAAGAMVVHVVVLTNGSGIQAGRWKRVGVGQR